MATIDRQDAHLLLAAIRVLSHLNQRSPRPDEVAELLELPEATVRMRAVILQDLGAMVLVESAYEIQLEIRDYLVIEELEEARTEALAEDLAAFDKKKQDEAEKMARLFDDGTFEQDRKDKLASMDEELKAMPKKPRNPFGD